MSETPQETAQAWCEKHAEHKSVPGTKFVSGRLLCSRDDVVQLLQPLVAERDALRDGSDEDARALLHLNDLLTAAEAEVERLERARLRSADWLTLGKLEAEVERLRAEGLAIADGQIADRERLEGLLRRIVHGIDEWNSAVTPIIGRAVDYKWPALEEARAAAPEVKP